ncbi:cyclic nucleotide-binding domain-containing protein [Thermoleptolyngbya sp. PKUAC-SCTB121]|uniref:cyclic nucleotide-binding domain-containing protein n=1 Tax=Thermoleptolyngbya sp. PKUAC-SCTB121 TaxID=2811482 RepID=UPI0019627C24|nr:cyclic nucleotide-binding domain-containing protein [Thermoleptolyngbya sp. PKUAC-SCTB121]
MQKVLCILGELSDRDIDWLVQVGRKQQVPAGSVLIYEGHPVDTLYILLDGTLVVSISALDGRQIARLSSGELVGEMSFIDSRPPSATVQTLEDSTVLAIPRAQLAEKLQQDEGFGCRFYRALAILLSQRLRGTVKQLGDEGAKPTANGHVSQEDGVAIAQLRFERLLNQLQVQSAGQA